MNITAKELSIQDAAGMQLAELIRKLAAEVEESGGGIPEITAEDVGKILKAGEDGAEWGSDNVVIVNATVPRDISVGAPVLNNISITTDMTYADMLQNVKAGKVVVVVLKGTNDSTRVYYMSYNGVLNGGITVIGPDIVTVEYAFIYNFGSFMLISTYEAKFNTKAPDNWTLSYDSENGYMITDSGISHAMTFEEASVMCTTTDIDAYIRFTFPVDNDVYTIIAHKNPKTTTDYYSVIFYGTFIDKTTKKLRCVSIVISYDLMDMTFLVDHYIADISGAMWS